MVPVRVSRPSVAVQFRKSHCSFAIQQTDENFYSYLIIPCSVNTILACYLSIFLTLCCLFSFNILSTVSFILLAFLLMYFILVSCNHDQLCNMFLCTAVRYTGLFSGRMYSTLYSVHVVRTTIIMYFALHCFAVLIEGVY